jgi:hypothetical protein
LIAKRVGPNTRSLLPPLVFEKELTRDETREPQLQEWLDEIRDVGRGVTTDNFRNIIELRSAIRSALSNLLSREFLVAHGVGKPLSQQDRSEKEKKSIMRRTRCQPVKLGAVDIRRIKLPTHVYRKQGGKIFVKIEGYTNYGFLDLAIFDAEGNDYWEPDKKSWDQVKDRGTLNLDNTKYSSEWEFLIPTDLKSGPCTAFIGSYEDTVGLPTFNRRLTGYAIRKIEIRD